MKPVSPLQGTNAYLLLTLTPLYWACNMIVGRGLATNVPPMAITFFRGLAAITMLAPSAWLHVRRDRPLVRRRPCRQGSADRGLGAVGTTTK